MNNIITKHSLERMKIRHGINKKRAVKRISCAVSRGKSAEYFSSRERSYLLNKTDKGYKAVAYNGFCYIISDSNVCVTLYSLPKWFCEKKYYNGKVKIRNIKKYIKNHSDFKY